MKDDDRRQGEDLPRISASPGYGCSPCRALFSSHFLLRTLHADSDLRLIFCARSDKVSNVKVTGFGRRGINATLKWLRPPADRPRIRRDYESRRKSKFAPTEASSEVGIISK
jgi:hypothetical protein